MYTFPTLLLAKKPSHLGVPGWLGCLNAFRKKLPSRLVAFFHVRNVESLIYDWAGYLETLIA